MKSMIDVLAVNPPKTGVSRKTGNPYSITECECIVTAADGSRKVGVLTLSKELDGKVQPGQYEATFDISVAYDTRKIGAQVIALVPVKPHPAVVPPKP